MFQHMGDDKSINTV